MRNLNKRLSGKFHLAGDNAELQLRKEDRNG
jgi:hypothetical protein